MSWWQIFRWFSLPRKSRVSSRSLDMAAVIKAITFGMNQTHNGTTSTISPEVVGPNFIEIVGRVFHVISVSLFILGVLIVLCYLFEKYKGICQYRSWGPDWCCESPLVEIPPCFSVSPEPPAEPPVTPSPPPVVFEMCTYKSSGSGSRYQASGNTEPSATTEKDPSPCFSVSSESPESPVSLPVTPSPPPVVFEKCKYKSWGSGSRYQASGNTEPSATTEKDPSPCFSVSSESPESPVSLSVDPSPPPVVFEKCKYKSWGSGSRYQASGNTEPSATTEKDPSPCFSVSPEPPAEPPVAPSPPPVVFEKCKYKSWGSGSRYQASGNAEPSATTEKDPSPCFSVSPKPPESPVSLSVASSPPPVVFEKCKYKSWGSGSRYQASGNTEPSATTEKDPSPCFSVSSESPESPVSLSVASSPPPVVFEKCKYKSWGSGSRYQASGNAEPSATTEKDPSPCFSVSPKPPESPVSLSVAPSPPPVVFEMCKYNSSGLGSRYQASGNAEPFLASTAKDRIVFADPDGGVNQTKLTILGHEETWQNSSLMLCESEISNPPIERQEHGAIVLSQVHLELGAVEGIEHEEILRGSEKYRKEIVKDILSDYLKMEVSDEVPLLDYTHAYFLGMHDAKVRFIDQIRYSLHDGILKIGPMELKFVGKDEVSPDPSRYMLPVFMYSCPTDFSTLEYFENLESLYVGRLVIYAEVLSSSMDIVNAELANGLAVVVTQQTAGKGRSSNQWLSPPGCTMFSLQLHFPLDSYLGCHPSVLQHIVAVAVVQALSELNPDYKKALDLRLKWPNDIYHGNSVKLGGLIATCLQSRGCIIANVGCGINLDNDSPTTCLNRLIRDYNRAHNKKLTELSREFLLAIMFTEIERMVGIAQGGEMKLVENMYYHFWLHSGAKVRIVDSSQKSRNVTVHGIDDFGFLQVRDEGGNVFTVHPDGNSFDMMEGLIAPKIR